MRVCSRARARAWSRARTRARRRRAARARRRGARRRRVELVEQARRQAITAFVPVVRVERAQRVLVEARRAPPRRAGPRGRAGRRGAPRRNPRASPACPGSRCARALAGACAFNELHRSRISSGRRRVVGAERLDVQRQPTAGSGRPGRLVPEERAPRPELDRLGQLVHSVPDVSAAEGGGRLGPQRERAAGLVLEGEHLLLDDVRRLPHPAREQLGVLERSASQGLVARAAEDLSA